LNSRKVNFLRGFSPIVFLPGVFITGHSFRQALAAAFTLLPLPLPGNRCL